VTVKLRDLEKYDDLIAAAMESGANELQGAAFSLSTIKGVEQEARRRAVDDAKEKAQLLAKSAGASLGRIHSIAEQGSERQPPGPLLRAMALGGAEPAPDRPSLAAGEITVRVVVQAVWDLAE
jgi:hypothetical protein